MLLEWEGFSVLTARNGEEGFLHLREEVGVVLLDLMMPVMNGWEFLEKKRHSTEFKDVPVVVVSAAVPGDGVHDMELCREEVAAILRKPIESDELLKHVAAHCAPSYELEAARNSCPVSAC